MSFARIACSVIAIAASSSSFAGWQDSSINENWGGSYLDSCVNVASTYQYIEADCRDMNGYYRHTVLRDPSTCTGDISNYNGQLNCSRYQGGTPAGSYRRTCTNVAVRGDTLFATCRDMNGYWVQTSLSYFRECHSDIRNNDGNLQCDY